MRLPFRAPWAKRLHVSGPTCSRCRLDRWSDAIASAGSSTSTAGQSDEVTEKGLTTQAPGHRMANLWVSRAAGPG